MNAIGEDQVHFRNDAESTIPPFGVVRLLEEPGAFRQSGQRDPYVKVGQPNCFGSQYTHFINGYLPVEPGEFGIASNPACRKQLVRFNGGSTPNVGDHWGPVDGSWELDEGAGGFVVVGPVIDNRCVWVAHAPMLLALGKSVTDWTKNTAGVVSLHKMGVDEGLAGATFDEVRNRFADIDADKWVKLAWCGPTGTDWEVIAAEC